MARQPVKRRTPIYPVVNAAAGLMVASAIAFGMQIGVNSLLLGFLIGLQALQGANATVGAKTSTSRATAVSAVTVLVLCIEGVVIAGAAVWVQGHDGATGPLALGFLAFAGALLLTYAHARILASAHLDLPDGPLGLASRDVRLLVLAAGVALEQAYVALIVVAALAHGAVLLHLLRLRLSLRD